MKYIRLITFTVIYMTLLSLYPNIIYNVSPDGIGIHSIQGAKQDIENRFNEFTNQDIIVELEDGVYYLDNSLAFDSSTSNFASITYRAKEGTHPVLDGGLKITSWQTDDINPKIVKVNVDKYIRNLWVNDVRMKRADGFTGYATDIFKDTTNGNNKKGLLFLKNDFPDYNDTSGLELVYYKSWRNYYFKVEGIYDHDNLPSIPEDMVLVEIEDFNIALVHDPKVGVGLDNPFYFENTLELMDTPGEWCYIPSTQTLYYYMKEDESIDNLNVIIPNLKNIIRIKSSTEEKVRNLVFRDLEFSHSYYDRPTKKGFITLQSSACHIGLGGKLQLIPGAITIEDAENIQFKSCRFNGLTTNGLHVYNNVNDVNVEECQFNDISGGAICISDMNHKIYSDTIKPVRNILINNNLITNIGVEFASCPAIEVFYGEDVAITHNEIYESPYTGISIGWGWSMEPNTQKNIKVKNNKIIGDTQRCVDGGAIYTLSHFGEDGLTIEGNYIDEISFNPLATTQGAIYTDEGSSNIKINKNVILTDRNWFFYHRSGQVEVDSVFVLREYHDKYGGIVAPQGGTSITYLENGNHIFDLPHEIADTIILKAGIKKICDEECDTPQLEDNQKDYVIEHIPGGIRIIPIQFPTETNIKIHLFGIHGDMERSAVLKDYNPVILTGLSTGVHIVQIKSNKKSEVYKVII